MPQVWLVGEPSDLRALLGHGDVARGDHIGYPAFEAPQSFIGVGKTQRASPRSRGRSRTKTRGTDVASRPHGWEMNRSPSVDSSFPGQEAIRQNPENWAPSSPQKRKARGSSPGEMASSSADATRRQKDGRPRSRQSVSVRFDASAFDSSEDYEYEEWGISMQQELKKIQESRTPRLDGHFTVGEVENYLRKGSRVEYPRAVLTSWRESAGWVEPETHAEEEAGLWEWQPQPQQKWTGKCKKPPERLLRPRSHQRASRLDRFASSSKRRGAASGASGATTSTTRRGGCALSTAAGRAASSGRSAVCRTGNPRRRRWREAIAAASRDHPAHRQGGGPRGSM